VSIYVNVEDGVIKDISFQGSGCAISKASASLMTTVLKGRSMAEAEAAFQQFHELVTADTEEEPDLDQLGKLAVFSGVREFPARVKCASLAWHTVHAALNEIDKPATTE
jgi:nitrogen fixation NifU-like protein